MRLPYQIVVFVLASLWAESLPLRAWQSGEPTPAPRVLSPQKAQPISRDAAQRSEPATVTIRDDAGPSSASPSQVRSTSPAAESVMKIEPATQAAEVEPLIEAAMLKGIQPGVSTMAQVRASWGEPEKIDRYPQHVEHKHRLEPFAQVVVAYQQGTVSTIVVHLQAPLRSDAVTAQLNLGDLAPALIFDPNGGLLGQVFPERGVLFSFQPGAAEPLVTQIVLEGIQPQPFAIRAESRLAADWSKGLKDVEQALRLEPRFARAHWLKAQFLASSGRIVDALAAAEDAMRLDANNVEYRLTHARLCQMHGEKARAVSETKAALQLASAPLSKARGLCLLADLAASGRDYSAAVQYRQDALSILEPMLAKARGNVAAAVREAMLAANLGTARDIAWGPWNRKAEVVPKWLADSQTLALEDNSAPEVACQRKLQIARAALGALAGMQGELDPTNWMDALEAGTQEALAASDDPLRRGQLQWDYALACFDGMQVYHARGDSQRALRASEKAIESLTQCAAVRGESREHNYLLGRLHFRTGAVHAVLKSSHSQAVSCYEKALPLLTDPPATAAGEIGRQGESLVSMAVSFWEVGQRNKALELTSQGLAQMQNAVGQGLMGETSLSVPYSNLAQMHRRMGDMQSASRFAQLASRSQGALK